MTKRQGLVASITYVTKGSVVQGNEKGAGTYCIVPCIITSKLYRMRSLENAPIVLSMFTATLHIGQLLLYD